MRINFYQNNTIRNTNNRNLGENSSTFNNTNHNTNNNIVDDNTDNTNTNIDDGNTIQPTIGQKRCLVLFKLRPIQVVETKILFSKKIDPSPTKISLQTGIDDKKY
ncbi:unnamed protein product [Cunninghamella blakesleeana]